jgi:hypothetical protein
MGGLNSGNFVRTPMTKREEYDALAAEMKADWRKAVETKGTPGQEGWKKDPPEDAWRAAVAKAYADQKKLDELMGAA